MKTLCCLRCKTQMEHLLREKLQLGQTGWILGDIPNLLSGAIELDLYSCPRCGKVEFFLPKGEADPRIAQKKCPACGKTHDLDYPKCPFCKYDYGDRERK